MAAPESWTVHPHQPLAELGGNLWCVEGEVPGTPLTRRMTLIRLASGDLVIHNAMALEEDLMKRIESWGKPAYIVVPGGYHRLDCATFKARYPNAKIVCPEGSRKRIERVVDVDLAYADFPQDESVSFEELDGTKRKEGVMRVRDPGGTTLVFNNVLFNMQHQPGFSGFVLKLIGTSGSPRVTAVARMLAVSDKALLRAHLERLATPDVCRLIPGHGELVESDAASVLRSVAERL